jgi:hypothetical protein
MPLAAPPALAGLSLGDAKAKGPPGNRRIEVELVRSERRARDVKRWLVDNGYFSDRNRVLYILHQSDTCRTLHTDWRRLLSSRDYSRVVMLA